MSSLLDVLAWLCIGLGAVFTALPLRALARSPSAHGAKKANTWAELRAGLSGVSVGLALFALRTHGPVSWLLSIPVFAMVTLIVALWTRSRIRRRSGGPTRTQRAPRRGDHPGL
jgi:cobalamin synthase